MVDRQSEAMLKAGDAQMLIFESAKYKEGDAQIWILDQQNVKQVMLGATSGLGKETARVLALHGAHVAIMALKLDDGLAIKETIQIESPQATVDVMHLDLASLKSVKTFADEYKGLNILWHYYLTLLLLDNIKATAKDSGIEGHIVFTDSEGHYFTYKEGINFLSLKDPAI
ncbi:unnamed protein product [Sphagnum jensenii]|uniref:Uncharacterized protein n=1 Tax=Sphagnum jensenii TaxID=128206 RepID=A0ABP1BP20_9BRYO